MPATQPSPAQTCPQVLIMTSLPSKSLAFTSQIQLPGEPSPITHIHTYKFKTFKEKKIFFNWDILKCSNTNSATYSLIFDKSKAPQDYAAFIMKFNILHCAAKMSKTNQIYNDSQIPVSLI